MKIFLETLVYIIKDKKILLIEKKRGLGQGLINAPGGKIEKEETPEEAAKREVFEELKIKVKNLKFSGFLEFLERKEKEIHYVYVFTTGDFEGTPTETDEAKPLWVSIAKIPYNKMWEDDKYWLPLLLEGKKIFGKFEFENWKLKKKKVYILC